MAVTEGKLQVGNIETKLAQAILRDDEAMILILDDQLRRQIVKIWLML
jgi:hypothetical protein|tara:strand:- start:19770 stop:19913 length:144 start_codon:yes stop_codon:yes gene_type:complete